MEQNADESIEILSGQYRPTRSVLEFRPVLAAPATATTQLNGQKRVSGSTDSANSHRHPERRPIRSVDDYERREPAPGGAGYYFKPAGRTESTGGGGKSGGGGGPDTAMNGGRGLLLKNGSAGEALDAESAGSAGPKEPLSADEKKRKRITLAVGIIAGIIIVASVLLVGVTLNMTSKIDAIGECTIGRGFFRGAREWHVTRGFFLATGLCLMCEILSSPTLTEKTPRKWERKIEKDGK